MEETLSNRSFLPASKIISLFPLTNDSSGILQYLFKNIIIFKVKGILPFSSSDTLVLPPNKGAISVCRIFIYSILSLMASIGSGASIGKCSCSYFSTSRDNSSISSPSGLSGSIGLLELFLYSKKKY